MQHTHSTSETDQILQDNCMFACIHLTHKEGWHLIRTAITTHTNFFLTQQEYKGITSLNKKMTVTSLLHQLEAEDLIRGIIKEKDHQIESRNTTPLINNLEMQDVFEDKNGERRNGVTDLINGLVNLLSLETRAV